MDDYNQNMTLYLRAILDQLDLLRQHLATLKRELDERDRLLNQSRADGGAEELQS
jgi:hypothetical protein